MPPNKVLSLEIAGDDINAWMTKVTRELFSEKAIKKKNALINRGLKAAAFEVLPTVWANQGRRRRTGATQIFTDVKRVRGGGWRIASPTKRQLAVFYPNIMKAKGYYPAAQEYGFKHSRSGAFIEGTSAMGDAMDMKRNAALQKAVTFYIQKLERQIRRHKTKKIQSFEDFSKNLR